MAGSCYYRHGNGDFETASELGTILLQDRERWSNQIISFLACIVLIGYFWSLAADGLWMHFAADDSMNLAGYQLRGLGNLLWDCLAFFNGSYRPLGGLLYLGIYKLAHLNPLPCRIALLGLLTLNVIIAFHFVLLVTQSRSAAFFAVLAGCYHVNLLALYYYNSYVYDILCFTFYFSTLICYLRRRRSGAQWRWRHVFCLSALYICALDAKEMAITIPGVLIAYEVTHWPGRGGNWKALCAVVLITLAYIPGMGYLLDAGSPNM